MTHRVLDRALKVYRIGDADGVYPIFSGEGARLTPGRWNDVGQPVIYTSEHYSTAILEKLVRLGEMPPNQHFIEITIERGVSYEQINQANVPGWYEENQARARRFGGNWFTEARSAILIVPSVVARMDHNILINPNHPDFKNIHASLEQPIWWDKRLFAS